ncbi:helix-turn-helix domain-containing protein [Psychroserpens burtonensis]|uniref:helix-turn-helix domain-containing protein n=1 Tax=Psychroserpens burtonensis TaxID=49278 RepID=UPI000424425B|nr:helix-turn-helix domain-containing protein [Psychroserpens burtonensis]
MEVLKFEQLPNVVTTLTNEVRELKAFLLNKAETLQQDNPLTIKEVAELLHLSVPTLYGYVQRNEIPYHKKGNRLYFFKTEIIEDFVKTGKQKTLNELEAETDEYLSNKNKGLK